MSIFHVKISRTASGLYIVDPHWSIARMRRSDEITWTSTFGPVEIKFELYHPAYPAPFLSPFERRTLVSTSNGVIRSGPIMDRRAPKEDVFLYCYNIYHVKGPLLAGTDPHKGGHGTAHRYDPGVIIEGKQGP